MRPIERYKYPFKFWLLCLSSVLFMASFNMIIPELPAMLSAMGGGEWKGLIIALFTVTAALSRPFSGKMADTIGRIPVMIIGCLVCIVCSLLYPFVTGIVSFFALRLFHGFSTGFKPTGTTAYLADFVPMDRRGEAMGVLGICGSAGMAGGPALGAWVAQVYGLNAMFYLSAFVSVLSVLTILKMEETVKNPSKFSLEVLKIGVKDIYDKQILIPAIVMLLTVYSFGVFITLIPDLSDHFKLENRGYLFSVMVVASVFIRIVAGKASDRFGRIPLMIIGCLLLTSAMCIIAFSSSVSVLTAGVLIYGLSVGVNAPTIFAWTIDLADPFKRGKAMGTLFIAMEIGIGLGALISGFIYSDNVNNFFAAWISGAFSAFFSVIFLWINNTSNRS